MESKKRVRDRADIEPSRKNPSNKRMGDRVEEE